ncbi:unnamed protein product [marine sediment metagenome]|uniref:Uncharacterized protein n=1 Tax=marine sediment metagenome TaxID=412755 RepID=X1NUD1_9ZZZZ
MIEFVSMSEDDFDKYLSYITKNYADEKVKDGNWSKENAFDSIQKSSFFKPPLANFQHPRGNVDAVNPTILTH